MIKAVVFDLDGVIVSTDEQHYLAWQALADREGIEFNREINQRLRGVSRMDCLEILLERRTREYSDTEKSEMAHWKNEHYRSLLKDIAPRHILPGVTEWLQEAKRRNIKTAIGSSSRNAGAILEGIGLQDTFDAVVDGNDIQRSKPDPEVFLKAAARLDLPPGDCLVVEDAEAGVAAAVAAGMPCLAVGAAREDARAQFASEDLAGMTLAEVLS
jgi:beta-phosphoglucomutase